MEVVTLDVRGASLVNDESGIYRGGAQSTPLIDFKLNDDDDDDIYIMMKRVFL